MDQPPEGVLNALQKKKKKIKTCHQPVSQLLY